jgi:hypothetical protein
MYNIQISIPVFVQTVYPHTLVWSLLRTKEHQTAPHTKEKSLQRSQYQPSSVQQRAWLIRCNVECARQLHSYSRALYFAYNVKLHKIASVVYWAEFLAADPEVPGSITGATRLSK